MQIRECHMKLYSHPPRMRHIECAGKSSVTKQQRWINVNPKHRDDGRLQALIEEVIKIDLKVIYA